MFDFVSLPIIKSLIMTVAIVVVVFVVGYILKRILVTKIAVITARTPWKWDEIIDAGLGKIIVPLSIVAGLMISLNFWELEPYIYRQTMLVLVAMLVGIIGIFAMALTKRFILTYATDNGRPKPTATLTKNIINSTILVLGFFTILHLFGISITPLIAAVGVGSIGISLAAQDTLSNLFAGIYISLGGNMRGGDYIKLDSGQEGYIVDITWRETRLKMRDNNLMSIPNGKMATSVIMNYNLPSREVWVSFEFAVDGANSLEHIEKVTMAVAKEVSQNAPEAIASYEPVVRFVEMSTSSIKFVILIGAKTYDSHYRLRHILIKSLHDRFAQEKITLAS